TVPWTSGQSDVTGLFHAAHEQRYGYRLPEGEMMEVVTLRVTAVAPVDPPQIPQDPPGDADASAAIVGHKPVWFKQQPQPTALYDRARLRPGHQFDGPAVVFQYDTTIVIPPGWMTAVDTFHNLVLTKNH